jgi:DNA-binding winged helix-turn-helix (wHTH) protein
MSTQMVPMHSEEGENPSNGAFASRRYVRFGVFHLDLKKEELYKDGARVKLQGKVYQALVALLQKPGEIVRREDLRMQLWPSDTHVNYDANVNTTVNKLRQVLGDSAHQPAFVDTIPRQGYSFIAKIEYVDRPVAPLTSRLSEPAFVAATQERAASLFRTAILSKWFTGGVVVLVIASMLFGAALVLYAQRGSN